MHYPETALYPLSSSRLSQHQKCLKPPEETFFKIEVEEWGHGMGSGDVVVVVVVFP